MNPLILYHDNCFDGFCAAWVFHRVFPSAKFKAVQYESTPPDVTGYDVFIVDFSYSRAVTEQLAATANSIVILDHHRTALSALEGLPYATFDMSKSGARLAWEYVWDHAPNQTVKDGWHTREHPPWIVQYVEDRDLWKFSLPASREVNAAIRSYPKTFELFDQYYSGQSWELVSQGTAILRAEQQIVQEHLPHARPLKFKGVEPSGLVVNATILISEIAQSLAISEAFGAVFVQRLDGSQLWSLRARPDGADVRLIAEKFGGGGHKQAAGFKLNSWQEYLDLVEVTL